MKGALGLINGTDIFAGRPRGAYIALTGSAHVGGTSVSISGGYFR